WNRHVHHAAVVEWFDADADRTWATCPVTEAGFVRVSSNARAVGAALAPAEARSVLARLRTDDGHRFLANDVSMTDESVPEVTGYRQVTDALLLAVARRHGVRLVTFDAGLGGLGRAGEVEVLRA
ncbi:MAG TPA: TA system VapC family ribonuclease toxin, partial [Miltoncostaea sp.]|nr:TA system VapC family ribonuclease toxin [Miltoncostaea sp.]